MSQLIVNMGLIHVDAYSRPTLHQNIQRDSREKKPSPDFMPTISSLARCTLTTLGISFADMAFSNVATYIATKKLGFCFGNVISENGIGFLRHIERNIARVNGISISLLGESLGTTIMIPALCEEVEFRWFVQDVLLTKLPKKIIEQISPQMTSIINSVPARISRVAATAIIFALLHTHALPCSEGGGIHQLIGGLLYGSIYEMSGGSLLYCTNLHFIYNLVCSYR